MVMEFVEGLCSQRQSGRESVVSGKMLSDVQAAVTVKGEVESFLEEEIGLQLGRAPGQRTVNLIAIVGKAGDGKSSLAARLDQAFPGKLRVLVDATHSSDRSQDGTGELRMFLAPYLGPTPPEQLGVLCINVGRLIRVRDLLRETREAGLLQQLLHDLDIEQQPLAQRFPIAVLNLDARRLLALPGENDSLLRQMLKRIDPTHGVFQMATDACLNWHWPHFNAQALQSEHVWWRLERLLWEVRLGHNIHLSPRLAWELLSKITTGGAEIFAGQAPASRFAPAAQPPDLRTLLQNLFANLLFAGGDEESEAGPLWSALTTVDPARRYAASGHLLRAQIQVNLAHAATAIRDMASQAGNHPLLTTLADMLEKAGPSRDMNLCRMVQDTVLRLAYFLGHYVGDQEPLQSTPWLEKYLLLLQHSHSGDGPDLEHIPDLAHDAIAKTFGQSRPDGIYFATGGLNPASDYPALVKVSIKPSLLLAEPPLWAKGWTQSESTLLQSLRYLPDRLYLEYPKVTRLALTYPMYRLFCWIKEGYSAPSTDLEAFSALRQLAQRLSTPSEKDSLLIGSAAGNEWYHVERKEPVKGKFRWQARKGG